MAGGSTTLALKVDGSHGYDVPRLGVEEISSFQPGNSRPGLNQDDGTGILEGESSLGVSPTPKVNGIHRGARITAAHKKEAHIH